MMAGGSKRSDTKNGVAKGGQPRRDVLASLRMASLEESSKAALPAEILASVLDYLSAVDLIRVAQVSRLMREMAYDDTRWVQKLKTMGCWNELSARRHAEQMHGTIASFDGGKQEDLVERGHDAIAPGQTNSGDRESEMKRASDGFHKTTVTSTFMPEPTPDDLAGNDALVALESVRSVRGEARLEYGKVHALLAPFYDDISNLGPSPERLVFRRYSDPLHQAQILSQLQRFSKVDTTAGWRERVGQLQSTVSLFEAAALKEFQQGYEAEDIDGAMRKYAHVLSTLNGGESAVNSFVQQTHLVTRKSQFGRVADCIDEATGQVKLEHTQAFFTRLSVAYNEEVSIINRAFPPYINVAAPFWQKLNQDVLYPFLTAIFDILHSTHKEAYLTAISGTFVQCLDFSERIMPIRNASSDSIVGFREDVVAKVYEPHIDLYFAEELDFFRKRSEAAVSDWDRRLSEQAASTESFLMSNVNRQADKRDFLTSFKKVIMMPVAILPNFSARSGEPKSGTETPTPRDSLSASARNANRLSVLATPPSLSLPEAPTTELAAKAAIMKSKLEGISSLFSIEIALQLVHSAKSSMERLARFVQIGGQTGPAAKQQCEAIFVVLLQILGHRHVIVGFDKAVDHLSNYQPREQSVRDQSGVEPLVTFLELVNVGDLILQMVDVFYEQELIGKKLTDRNDFLDPAVKEKKRFEQMLDERVAAGLNKGISVLMEEVDYILATRQLATDFNPDISTDPHRPTMDVGVSEAAVAVVNVVSSHIQMLVGSTDKSTLDVFNQEVGVRLFTVLCKHIKRQRISVEGSLKMISDMNHYFRFIQSLKNQDLLVYFKAFRELSQLYLVDPSHAKELASLIADADRFHGIWRVEEVYEFAERRADWYQVKRDVERAMYGIGCCVM